MSSRRFENGKTVALGDDVRVEASGATPSHNAEDDGVVESARLEDVEAHIGPCGRAHELLVEADPGIRSEEALALGAVGEIGEEQLAAWGEELEASVDELKNVAVGEDARQHTVGQHAVRPSVQVGYQAVALVGEAPSDPGGRGRRRR